MASENTDQNDDLDRARGRLASAVARLETALSESGLESGLEAENARLREQARAAAEGLDATIARLRRLLGG